MLDADPVAPVEQCVHDCQTKGLSRPSGQQRAHEASGTEGAALGTIAKANKLWIQTSPGTFEDRAGQ